MHVYKLSFMIIQFVSCVWMKDLEIATTENFAQVTFPSLLVLNEKDLKIYYVNFLFLLWKTNPYYVQVDVAACICNLAT